MVRFRRIEQAGRFFFVTTNLRRGVQPFSARERSLVLHVIAQHRDAGDFWLFAYVVMPDHVHLLLAPRRETLTGLMRRWKSRAGFVVAHQRKTQGPLWQERFFDHIIRRVTGFWEKIEYIHTNPVEAGLARHPADWRWSSWNFYAKQGSVLVRPDAIELPADGDTLLWPAPWR